VIEWCKALCKESETVPEAAVIFECGGWPLPHAVTVVCPGQIVPRNPAREQPGRDSPSVLDADQTASGQPAQGNFRARTGNPSLDVSVTPRCGVKLHSPDPRMMFVSHATPPCEVVGAMPKSPLIGDSRHLGAGLCEAVILLAGVVVEQPAPGFCCRCATIRSVAPMGSGHHAQCPQPVL